ncbi:MAG: hypothetical protein TUN42_04285 [Dehalogenimonas sp.]
MSEPTGAVLSADGVGTSAQSAPDSNVQQKAGALEPKATEPTQTATTPAPPAQTPAPKTYTQEEYGKLQAAKDSEIAKIMQRVKAFEDKEAAALQAAQKAADNTLIEKVKAANGDVDAVKAFLAEREAFRAEQAAAKGEQEKMRSAARVLAANDLITQHGLDASAATVLMEATTPEAMKLKAFELQVEKLKASNVPSQTVDGGIGGGKGVDLSKITNPTDKLSRLYEMGVKK